MGGAFIPSSLKILICAPFLLKLFAPIRRIHRVTERHCRRDGRSWREDLAYEQRRGRLEVLQRCRRLTTTATFAKNQQKGASQSVSITNVRKEVFILKKF